MISPRLINNLKLDFNFSFNEKKKLIKQSYILLTWFYYLSFSTPIKNNLTKQSSIQIFILPLKKTKFTLTKAPMAHKTFSKEQYLFQCYRFIFTFIIVPHELNFTKLDYVIYLLLITKKTFPQFETNLLFLRFFVISVFYSDQKFFNFYKYYLN